MKPVAWMSPDWKFSKTKGKLFCIPLYTVDMESYVLGFEEGRLQGQLDSVLTDDEIITRYRELMSRSSI